MRGGEIRRIADAPDAALELAALAIAGQTPSPWRETASPDPHAAAETALKRYLEEDPSVSGWVALEGDRAVALLGATLEIVDEDHWGYTYLHPRHASTSLSNWAAASLAAARVHLPDLVGAVAADARPHRIERLLLQTRPHDWAGSALWRRMGMRPDVVLAGLTLSISRPVAAQRHQVRSATLADESALVGLAVDEHEFHAAHTRTGTRRAQSIEPTRREVAQAFEEQSSNIGETLVVDGPDGAPVGSLRAMVLELPADSPGRAYLPERYGYIGMTSVAPAARGTGVGGALVDAALGWFGDRGLDDVLLHYVDDNALARPFWSARGFAPIIVTLAGDVLR